MQVARNKVASSPMLLIFLSMLSPHLCQKKQLYNGTSCQTQETKICCGIHDDLVKKVIMLHELLFYNTSTHPKGNDMPLNFINRISTYT